jgi:hypothetical protein
VENQLGPRERGCLSIPQSTPLCKARARAGGGGGGGGSQKGQSSDAESRRLGSVSREGGGQYVSRLRTGAVAKNSVATGSMERLIALA